MQGPVEPTLRCSQSSGHLCHPVTSTANIVFHSTSFAVYHCAYEPTIWNAVPLLLQRPPVMGHELPLPTPGMPPRSIEGEAEKLAGKLLAQTGVSCSRTFIVCVQ
jgi:hypothetical protein